MALATRSPCSRVTHGHGLSGVSGWSVVGRKSALQPTSMTGMVGPQIFRTSSIHYAAEVSHEAKGFCAGHAFVVTFSNESGVSIANAMRMTCDLE